MSTTTETTVEPIAETPIEPTGTATKEATEPAEGEDESTNPGREAARYRRQLRDVEAERDTLTDQLAAARRTLVEHGLGNVPAGAFWTLNPDPAALLDDDGNVDPAKVAEAARDAFATLGLPGTWRDPARRGAIGPYLPSEGGTTGSVGAGESFTAAFGPQGD